MESIPCVRNARPEGSRYVRDAYSVLGLLLVVLGACVRDGAGAPVKELPAQTRAPSPSPTTPVPQAAPQAATSAAEPALEHDKRDRGAGGVADLRRAPRAEPMSANHDSLAFEQHGPSGASVQAVREAEGAPPMMLSMPAARRAPAAPAMRSRSKAAYQPAGVLTPRIPAAPLDAENYAHHGDNPFVQVADSPLSTFSIDVDTASYSNVRRFLRDGQLPPADAVRVEEMINYFRYAYPRPPAGQPLAVYSEVAAAPWNPEHRLVQIGLRSHEQAHESTPARNLVFLIDVSGSMASQDKLPLLKRGLGLLTRDLRQQDRIAIVVYAGASGLVLPSTRGSDHARISAALEQLEAGGSTNGGEGIEAAYRVAEQHFVKGGINRVVLATDGDFNVGVTSEGELTRLIEAKRKTGVFLTVLGFGTGNIKDSTMELLADKGDGNYAYIDSLEEAHKVLVREAGSTLVTVAKDVKLQIEWNPKRVASYRLIGYENRMLADRDFKDDTKDAGEIGSGHTVTALYEVELAAGADDAQPGVDPLRYQTGRALTTAAQAPELLTLKLRYKAPTGGASTQTSVAVPDRAVAAESGSEDFRWAAAVAGFGMLLRGSPHAKSLSVSLIRALATSALGADESGDRAQFIELIGRASDLHIEG